MIPRSNLCFAGCLLVSPLVAQDYEFVAGPTAVLQFEKTEFDFGRIRQQSENSHVFKFKNTGSVALLIESASASCGCIESYFSKTPVQPGGESEVRVLYKPGAQEGSQTKTVTITSNSFPKQAILRIRAYVLAGDLEPSQQSNERAGLSRQGSVVLKPGQAFDTRDGRIVDMRSTAFGSDKLDIGYFNNLIYSGPYKKDGNLAQGGTVVYDHGVISIADLLAKHKKQGDMAWMSGTSSNRVVQGHCYTFAFPGRPPMYVKVVEVRADKSIKLAWWDTDERMSKREAEKAAAPYGAVTGQLLQGKWQGQSSGQEMTARFTADSIAFEGGLAAFLGTGPYKYMVTGNTLGIVWKMPPAETKSLTFLIYKVGDNLFLFEGKKEYTDIKLTHVP